MPQQIPIQPVPNQSLTVVLDNNSWNIQIKATTGVMSVSLALNGVDVLDNMRAVAGMRLIPSQYEEAGNFIITSQNFELPDYQQFGVTQYLLYFSASELVALRPLVPAQITAAFFNPIAALPLRFAPQGYVLA